MALYKVTRASARKPININNQHNSWTQTMKRLTQSKCKRHVSVKPFFTIEQFALVKAQENMHNKHARPEWPK
jgi:hypothetical protein